MKVSNRNEKKHHICICICPQMMSAYEYAYVHNHKWWVPIMVEMMTANTANHNRPGLTPLNNEGWVPVPSNPGSPVLVDDAAPKEKPVADDVAVAADEVRRPKPGAATEDDCDGANWKPRGWPVLAVAVVGRLNPGNAALVVCDWVPTPNVKPDVTAWPPPSINPLDCGVAAKAAAVVVENMNDPAELMAPNTGATHTQRHGQLLWFTLSVNTHTTLTLHTHKVCLQRLPIGLHFLF